MDAARRVLKVLAICCLCNMASHAQPTGAVGGPDDGDGLGVAIEIAELDVNDSTLTLSYNIINGSDRDAWVCTRVGSLPFEVFLASDKQTLVIRKRLDVPRTQIWDSPLQIGEYVRVAAGASLPESVQIAVPVTPSVIHAVASAPESRQPVRRLALEIGYYDEDLPASIHSILAVAVKSGLMPADVPDNILDTYFRGVRLRVALESFDRLNKDPYAEGRVKILYNDQALTGEKVLRVDVNDVSIPYKES
jgi:hypothetical protein